MNLVTSELLSEFETITNKSKNILINLQIIKMLDIILYHRWFSVEDKDTWTIIYLVNYIFDLHDIFIGSFVSQRIVQSAKRLLLQILEYKKDSLQSNIEQSAEVNSLLSTEAIRGNKSVVLFETDSKLAKDLLSSIKLESKIDGLKELFNVFSKCQNLSD